MPGELRWRRPRGADQARVLAVLDDWWSGFGGEAGSRQRALLLPRLFFQHFADTSVLGEAADGRLTAFLIAFRSAAQPDAAYIHFVGVDPALRRRGVAAGLYRWLFAQAAADGARRVEAITSPGNATSVAFHTALGFRIIPGQRTVDGVDVQVDVQVDYDGPGLHRIAFTRPLTHADTSPASAG
ncbi:acetyltransferase [Frankia sp. ACN1ag]|nr:acetyltransferase [Frankia sp. ACN1ag]